MGDRLDTDQIFVSLNYMDYFPQSFRLIFKKFESAKLV